MRSTSFKRQPRAACLPMRAVCIFLQQPTISIFGFFANQAVNVKSIMNAIFKLFRAFLPV